jgi:hypothetical protein
MLGAGILTQRIWRIAVDRRFCLLVSLLGLAVFAASAQAPSTQPDRGAGVVTAFARAGHLKRGINASMWFAQSTGNYSDSHLERYIDAADFGLIAKMGFDNVRLSVDAAPLTAWPHGKDGLNEDFVAHLDRAVDGMVADGLAVQIDLHPEEPFKLALRSGNEGVERTAMLWQKLAAHYADRDPEMVFFEIMNEPEVGDPYRWAGIQARVAEAIREVAPRHTIIATGPNYSDLSDLLTQQPLADGNVIYNFHFYNPHEFTHQGAGWGSPWWSYTHNIPYPASEASMEAALKQVPDAPNRAALERYWLDHWDAHRIKLLMDEAAAWGHANRVPLICNEFGVFRDHSDPQSRANWIRDMRTAMEADGIGWTMWDYRGNFGVVTKEDGQPAQVDENVAEALGLKK